MNIRKHISVLSLAVLLLSACSTPKNITYFEGVQDGASLRALEAKTITLKPLDKISIIVNSRDPAISMMFNMPYMSRRLGDSQSLTSGVSTSSEQGLVGYTVDRNGDIDFPILGKIHAAGLLREELAETIKQKLEDSRQIKDPVVTIDYMNLGFTILGEVSHPGRYQIDRDRFTLLDAIGLAGDLTINGNRTNVALLRNEGNADKVYRMNLAHADSLYMSPAFFIQQSDVIYVSPNSKRQRESTVNGNNVRSTAFWISLTSLLTSIAVLIVNMVK